MNKKIPVGVYPFTAELLPIVRRFESFQEKYVLRKVFSYPGSGLTGKDVAYACNQPDIGIQVEKIEQSNLQEIETLIIINPLKCSDKTNNHLIQVAKEVLQQGKNVLMCCNPTDSIVEPASQIKKNYHSFNFSFDAEKFTDRISVRALNYRSLDVPVIYVGSLVENPDTLETICYLCENYSKVNKTCLVFCNTPGGVLFNFNSLLSILNMYDLSEATRIEEMNRYANYLILQKNPDILIVEAPDAVMKFSNVTPNGFGILSYMVSQALQPNQFICSVPFELAFPKMIDLLSNDFETRLGSPITAAIATNIVVDSAENIQSHEMSFIFVPTCYSKHIAEDENVGENIPIYRLSDSKDFKLFQDIMYD